MTFKTFGITGRMRTNTKADFFLHAVRLQESEINFVFCERVLYVGTAPEQKAKSAKSGLNTTFNPLFPTKFSICRGPQMEFRFIARRVLATLSTVCNIYYIV